MVFEQYIVIADYQKKNRNDISLSAGDTVDVIERNELGENATNTINNFFNLENFTFDEFFQHT